MRFTGKRKMVRNEVVGAFRQETFTVGNIIASYNVTHGYINVVVQEDSVTKPLVSVRVAEKDLARQRIARVAPDLLDVPGIQLALA